MNKPWFKFHPRDWRGDQALRAVSMAARGFWMECLCIMHEAKPYGHLVLNGQAVVGDALARMTGASVDEVSTYLEELRQAGVLSVTGKGVVYSRRMVADHGRAVKGKRSVARRWAQGVENNTQSAGPNRVPNRGPITQSTEKRDNSSPPEDREKEAPDGASKKTVPKRRTQIPEDWVPDERNRADALNAGISEQDIHHEALKFRDFHRSKGNVFADIPAAWRTWCRNARGGGRMARQPNPGSGQRGVSLASIAARNRYPGEF